MLYWSSDGDARRNPRAGGAQLYGHRALQRAQAPARRTRPPEAREPPELGAGARRRRPLGRRPPRASQPRGPRLPPPDVPALLGVLHRGLERAEADGRRRPGAGTVVPFQLIGAALAPVAALTGQLERH